MCSILILSIGYLAFWFLRLQLTLPGQSARKIQTLRLIRKANIDAKWWVHVTGNTLGLGDGLELLHICSVKLDELTVLIDA